MLGLPQYLFLWNTYVCPLSNLNFFNWYWLTVHSIYIQCIDRHILLTHSFIPLKTTLYFFTRLWYTYKEKPIWNLQRFVRHVWSCPPIRSRTTAKNKQRTETTMIVSFIDIVGILCRTPCYFLSSCLLCRSLLPSWSHFLPSLSCWVVLFLLIFFHDNSSVLLPWHQKSVKGSNSWINSTYSTKLHNKTAVRKILIENSA